MKDYNNESGNGREIFTYYEELNDILGCRVKITFKIVVECGFEDDNLVIFELLVEELLEFSDNESVRDREE